MEAKMRGWIAAAAGLALAIGVTGSAKASVTTIYSDAFDGTAGPVAGRAVPVANGVAGGTAGATWAGDATTSANPDAVFTTSGGTTTTADSTYASVGAFSTGADANMITNSYLPFSPQAGYVYDFHLDILPSSVGASGNWLGMAFAQAGLNGHTAGGPSSALSNDNPFGMIILKGSGVTQAFAGIGTANGQTLANSTNLTGTSASGTFNTVDILLDTRGTNYTVNWVLNGTTELATPYTYATNPSIGAIVFGTNKLTGAVANFSLTATPEPASLAFIGLLGVAAIRRRRA